MIKFNLRKNPKKDKVLAKIEELSANDWQFLINQWIFHERNRQIMIDRIVNGLTYEQIAEKYDMSSRNVPYIVFKCEKQLLKRLTKL